MKYFCMTKRNLAIIVPTRDRPTELACFLQSLLTQDIKPVQIIIVDGGSVTAQNAVTKFINLPIDYITGPGSLTAQRNIGLKNLNKEAMLVAFFDDDIILERDSLKNMDEFWKHASSDTAGASFNNISDSFKKPTLLEKAFLVNSDKPGMILRSGFQSKLCSLDSTTRVGWLLGGATVWRSSVFDKFMFDESFEGYARYEDVDFSYRVGKEYKMYVVADAKVRHPFRLENLEFSVTLGKMQVLNRLYFVKKNPELSVLLCYWACLGLFLNNLIKGLFRNDLRYVLRSKGNMTGFLRSLRPHNFRQTLPR